MSTIAVNAITDANDGNTTTINGVTPNSANVVGKNRIINGNMMIDQRNAGASVSIDGTSAFPVDRFYAACFTASTGATAQQSTTAPNNYINSLKITIGTGQTVASGGVNYVEQKVEGLNVFDLGWGTASASTVTLSFWTRSSLTGTFGGALQNSAGNRSYPFTYTISSANTWEQKTITIVGDTTGTWLTTNGVGIRLFWGLGVGSTYSGTADAWAAANYLSATGATSVVGTSGATFYITGVQLEVGESATEFEHRPYGTELGLCQRYYQQPLDSGLDFFAGYFVNGNYGPSAFDTWVVEMRATPTVVLTLGTLNAVGSVSVNYFDKKRWHLNPTANATSNGFYYVNKLTADAEL
jgi:hypothetical protein